MNQPSYRIKYPIYLLIVVCTFFTPSCKSNAATNNEMVDKEQKDTHENKEAIKTIKGKFIYMADLALFTFCGTNIQIPVAMEGNYINAERAYTGTKHKDMEPLFMEVIGSIDNRDNGEGKMMPHLIIEKLILSDFARNCE